MILINGYRISIFSPIGVSRLLEERLNSYPGNRIVEDVSLED
jgi:hypothetical protein